jgi:hypothetical protein
LIATNQIMKAPSYIGCIQRSTTILALQLAPILHELTSQHGYSIKHLPYKNSQHALQNVLRDIITNSNRDKVTLEVVHNTREGWQEIQGCHSIDDY